MRTTVSDFSLKALRSSFGVWFGGIWLAVGLPFVLLAGWFLAGERQFATEAKVVEGTVVSKNVHRSNGNGSGQRRSSATYSVSYRFTAPDGTVHQGRSALPYERWVSLRETAPILVEYLPSDPSSNRPAGTTKTALLLIFVAVGIVLSGVGGSVVFVSVRRVCTRLRLLRAGVNTTGTVVQVAPMNLHINGHRQWRVEYEYRDYEGRVHRKRTRMVREQAALLKVGAAVAILMDPMRPQLAMLQPTP